MTYREQCAESARELAVDRAAMREPGNPYDSAESVRWCEQSIIRLANSLIHYAGAQP